LASIGLGVAAIERMTQPVGAVTYLRWLARGRTLAAFGPPAVVGLGSCPGYGPDLLDCLRSTWQQAAMPEVQGKRVLVKPNLVDVVDGHPATTAPEVVGAVLDLLHDLGAARVVVGDGPAFRREAASVVTATGLDGVLARRGIPFIDLNYDDPKPVPLRDGWFTNHHQLWLPRHVREAELIVSVPRLKTHHWTRVSLSLKNLIGVVPGARYGWPKNIVHVNAITPSILGIYNCMPPVVAVVDGVIGMEHDGPLFGTPVHHGMLTVGADPVAVDILCARLMGIALTRTDHPMLAAWAGLGQGDDIEVRGARPEDLQRSYAPPPGF
jgi:uncharacterized protein (DUF362 family)